LNMDGLEKKVSNLLKEFRKEYDGQGNSSSHQKCQKLFSQLKILLVQFKLSPPFPKEKGAFLSVKKHLTFARETYELGAFLSVAQKDESSFERYVAFLKTYYNDYKDFLPESEWKWPILGLHLMALLAQNRIADFHTELELVPHERQTGSHHILFPIELERWLMEGSYNKVLSARSNIPLPSFKFFMDKLMVTVREKMASCIEQAYETFPVDQVAKMLGFGKNSQEFKDYCKDRNWEGTDEISFNQGKNENLDIPAKDTIRQALLYASELERIV